MEVKKRASRPKVRTGCQVCKRRHKKCDETHPSCLMCIDSGRVCEYKETPDRRTRGVRDTQDSEGVVARRLVDPSHVGLTATERRYLELFRMHTSGQCGGSIMDDFWQRLIHQVSEKEPAVRHATIAISAIHWYSLNETNTENDVSFPIQQCNKAIASLRRNLTRVHAHVTSSAHREAVLVTCATLVCLALFQDDVKAVIKHLESGYAMLLEWKKTDFDGSPSGPILMRVFRDLHLHRITFSSRKSGDDQVYVPIWQKFTPSCEMYGYAEAQGSESELLVILGSVISANFPHGFNDDKRASVNDLMESATKLLYTPKEYEPAMVMGKLCAWKGQLQSFLATNADTLSSAELTPLILLEIWTEFTYLMIAYANSCRTEMVFDSHLPVFQRINKLAALFLASGTAGSSLFCAKVMFLPPIYFCAHKCRDWHTRRESLRLISESRRREGIWESNGASGVLEFFINEESKGLGPNDVIPVYSRIDMMHVSPVSEQLKGTVWYHRRCSPEEIAAGADPQGIWTNMMSMIPLDSSPTS